MKKMMYVLFTLTLICGCQDEQILIPELNDYYLSTTKSSEIDNKVYFQNVSFDFENFTTLKSDNIERNSQYPLFIYDSEYHRYLYSTKNENNEDNIFIYDINSKKEMNIDLEIWGVNYILVRKDDYIIVAVKNNTQTFAMYSVDKKTLEFIEIELPKDILDDLSVWQIAYIPQNDGLILQTYSINEEWQVRDQWNNETHDYRDDLLTPYYHYLYTDSKFEYLFKLDMPQSDGLLSNGKEVLVALNYINDNDKCVIRYNLDSKELTTEKYISSLNSVFYLDNNGRYIYVIGYNIHKYDTYTGEDEVLDVEFPFEGYNSNYILIKK